MAWTCRFRRTRAVDVRLLGSYEQSRHLWGVQGLRVVPEERVGVEGAERAHSLRPLCVLSGSAHEFFRCGKNVSAAELTLWKSVPLLIACVLGRGFPKR